MNVRVCNVNGVVVVVMMVLMSLDMTDAYADGPPLSTCSDMAVVHQGTSVPQTDPPPYKIISLNCYKPGKPLVGNTSNTETNWVFECNRIGKKIISSSTHLVIYLVWRLGLHN